MLSLLIASKHRRCLIEGRASSGNLRGFIHTPLQTEIMEAQEEDDEIFVYMGGDQRVPSGVRRARIHKSVKIILEEAFYRRQHLISVEFHDGIEIIEKDAFSWCKLLRGSIKLLGVRIIKEGAFYDCFGLTGLEFGDKLETIGDGAFSYCSSLKNITMPSVRTVGEWAFRNCEQLTELDLPEGLETIKWRAFHDCERLRRIALPLKDDMIEDNAFYDCPNLATVDLVGGIDKTVASLHLDSWRNEMTGEINRINQVLPSTNASEKTAEIEQWTNAVIRQLNHYKAEHKILLKEATTLLELALWKANLDDNEGGLLDREGVRTTRGQRKRARKEICITSGASIVIKNVLPFLKLE